MAERRIIMNNKVENFEWHSLLDFIKKYGKENEYLYHQIIKICEEDLK